MLGSSKKGQLTEDEWIMMNMTGNDRPNSQLIAYNPNNMVGSNGTSNANSVPITV